MEQEREINRLQQLNLAFERSNISSSNSRNSFINLVLTNLHQVILVLELNDYQLVVKKIIILVVVVVLVLIFTTIQSIALILLPPLLPLLLVLVLALVLVLELELELELVWVFQDPLIVSVLV